MLFIPVALAFAEEAGGSTIPGMAGLLNIAPLILLFIVFYFLLIRPQQKRAKEHKEMLKNIQKGDNVITTGGIHGRVTSVADDAVTVEIADNVRVKVSREAISIRKPQG